MRQLLVLEEIKCNLYGGAWKVSIGTEHIILEVDLLQHGDRQKINYVGPNYLGPQHDDSLH